MSEGAREQYDRWHRSLARAPSHFAPWHDLVRDAIDPARELRDKRVLELACGRGEFARWLSAQQPRLMIAADFSRGALEIARDRIGSGCTHLLTADAQRVGVRSESFRTVISCETLEHLSEPHRALAEFARVLEPGGRLYLTTPNYLGPMGLYRGYLRLTNRRYSEEGQRINRFLTFPVVRRWLRRAGFRVIGTRATGHYLPWPRRAPVLLRLSHPWLQPFALHTLFIAEKPSHT